MSTTMAKDIDGEVRFLARELKAPVIAETFTALGDQARTAATRGPQAATGTEVGQRSLSHYDEVFGLPSPPSPAARPNLQVVR